MNPSKKHPALIAYMQLKFAKIKNYIGTVLVLGLFLVHPFFFTSSEVYSNITFSKLCSFVAILSISVFSLIIVVLLFENKPNSGTKASLGKKLRSVRPYEWAMLAYLLVMIVSTILSENRQIALIGASYRNEGLLMMTAYLLTALLAGRIYRSKQWHFAAMGIAALLVCVYGIMQYYGFDPLNFNPFRWNVGPNIIYISTMSNRNVISTYLTIVFCICAVLFAQTKKHSRWIYLFAGMVVFYMLILGQTESGYIGLFFAFLFAFPLVATSRERTGYLLLFLSWCPLSIWISLRLHTLYPEWEPSFWLPFEKYLLPVFAFLLIAAAVFLFVKKLPGIPQKLYRITWYSLIVIMVFVIIISIPKLAEISDHPTIEEANQILQGNFDDRFGSWRGFIWKRAITLVPEKPLFGYGPDNFMAAFETKFGEEAIEVTNQSYDKAHSEYVQQLVDNGILGLLAFLSFFVLIILGARRHMDKPLVVALILALLCFLGQAFFNFSTPFVHPISWTLWGILAGFPFLEEKRV